MPAPRVFISSTYRDLVDARSSLEAFFKSILYEPITFERGGIHFDHTKALDLSCYDAVKECDLMILVIGGRYGTPASEEADRKNARHYNSITKTEYLEALSANIPIYTFVRHDVLGEHYTYYNQPKSARTKFVPKCVDNVLIFQLIQEIHGLKRNNLVIPHGDVTEMVEYLKKATASLVQSALASKRLEEASLPCSINGYKLYYHRRKARLSHTNLSNLAKIPRHRLMDFERVKKHVDEENPTSMFAGCTEGEIQRLEAILKCEDQLRAGREDDLLSLYIHYYHANRGSSPVQERAENGDRELFPTKIVVFDFDGTMTVQRDRTTWELIWEELGYTVQDCAKLHRQFSNGLISHDEWCGKTREAFCAKDISEETLKQVAEKTVLMAGAKELIARLEASGIEMHILSGSIEQIIRLVLGADFAKITHVQANSLKFTNGKLSFIQGTKYDFKGKAAYLKELMARKRVAPTEILFVGNSINDAWASKSGVTTLCVNPHFTDGHNMKEWLYCIREMHDMCEILNYVRVPETH